MEDEMDMDGMDYGMEEQEGKCVLILLIAVN